MDRSDKGYRGDAAQFFVAGELCRRGVVAVVTMGNSPNTDILCSNAQGTRFVHVQVKTFVPGGRTCSVGLKSERDYGEGFVWVLAGIPPPASPSPFQYYVIPAAEIASNVRECYRLWAEAPGRHGQPHQAATNKIRAIFLPPRVNANGWSLEQYLDRWDIIGGKLGLTLAPKTANSAIPPLIAHA
jgi:hypothetical protein